jgi:hypothetical protein
METYLLGRLKQLLEAPGRNREVYHREGYPSTWYNHLSLWQFVARRLGKKTAPQDKAYYLFSLCKKKIR